MNLFKNTPTTLAKHFLTKDSKNLSPQVIRNNMAKDGSYTKKRKELIQDVEAEFTKSTQYLGTTE